MSDSFDQALIPLSADPVLRDRYITTLGGVRMGRLLEDMDAFAVHLIHKHVKLPDEGHQGSSHVLPFSIVTALVDQIRIEGGLAATQPR